MPKPITITIESNTFFGQPIEGAEYEVTLLKHKREDGSNSYDVVIDDEVIGSVQSVRTEYQTFSGNGVVATGSRTRSEWRISGHYNYRSTFIRVATRLGFRYGSHSGWNPRTRAEGIQSLVEDWHAAKALNA